MEKIVNSIKTPIDKATIGVLNVGELLSEVLECPVVGRTEVGIMPRYIIKRNGELEPLAFKNGVIDAKVHRAVTALYDYLCSCPDKSVLELESLTSAMRKSGVIDEWSLKPFHQEKLGKVVKRVRGLKRYHYGHAGKYAHKVYQTKQKDRDQSTMYHEQSSRRIKSEVSQDSINLLSLISTLESISSRTLQTYTVGEKLTLIKQIQEALKVATSKGLTTEACELYRIFNESKFDELRNLVGSNSYNKQIAEMIVDSFAKHTRLAVTPYEELMTHAIAKVDGKTLTSEGVMAKYSKTCEAKKFIDDVYAGKYGKMYQGNNAFRTYLINKYNHYLDSSKGVESLTHYITNKLEREDRKHNSLYTPLSGKLISIVEGGKMVDGESYPVIIGRDDRVDSAIISYLDSQKITDDRTR